MNYGKRKKKKNIRNDDQRIKERKQKKSYLTNDGLRIMKE